jgi:hypothetical protein
MMKNYEMDRSEDYDMRKLDKAHQYSMEQLARKQEYDLQQLAIKIQAEMQQAGMQISAQNARILAERQYAQQQKEDELRTLMRTYNITDEMVNSTGLPAEYLIQQAKKQSQISSDIDNMLTKSVVKGQVDSIFNNPILKQGKYEDPGNGLLSGIGRFFTSGTPFYNSGSFGLTSEQLEHNKEYDRLNAIKREFLRQYGLSDFE